MVLRREAPEIQASAGDSISDLGFIGINISFFSYWKIKWDKKNDRETGILSGVLSGVSTFSISA